MAARTKFLLVLLVLLGLLMPSIQGLSWRHKVVDAPQQIISPSGDWTEHALPSTDDSSQHRSPSSDDSTRHVVPPTETYGLLSKFNTVLKSLEELQGQPLCNRIAARILINNCKLVDGKDYASIHTHSEHQVRTFMDMYSVSLALCDLDRGSFKIPPACAPFREEALIRVSINTDKPRLHVDDAVVRSCLAALGEEHSLWITYMSYKEKALQFCEAARRDNYKCKLFSS